MCGEEKREVSKFFWVAIKMDASGHTIFPQPFKIFNNVTFNPFMTHIMQPLDFRNDRKDQ